ncbi:hypothetical protein TL08_07555 [Actinoalloteichus hymeniacidonis]|uniref:DUF2613 family protein n=2 Tax=Actinoalloteichus hymeniacidonis TaxID=340345 RepID=A0AAC9HN40_9PSEU|nr:hypothetical protein TL08_07555 [Actinoalloteichus hymeniacidonis]
MRLGTFLLAVVAAFGLAYAAGALTGPIGEAPQPAHEMPADQPGGHRQHDDGR